MLRWPLQVNSKMTTSATVFSWSLVSVSCRLCSPWAGFPFLNFKFTFINWYLGRLIPRTLNYRTINPLNTLGKWKDTHGKRHSLNCVKIWEKDGNKGLNLSCRFRLFFFSSSFFLLVEALRMSLCLSCRILLLWLPESSMSYAFCSMPSMICSDAERHLF